MTNRMPSLLYSQSSNLADTASSNIPKRIKRQEYYREWRDVMGVYEWTDCRLGNKSSDKSARAMIVS